MYYHLISLLGARPKNEDEIEVIINMDNNNSNYKALNFFSIFDGHGGSLVSKYLKEHLPRYLYASSESLLSTKQTEYIKKVYDRLQQKIINSNLFLIH